MKQEHRTALLTLGVATGLLCTGTGTSDLPVHEIIPHVPQPGYLESYIDPVFGAKITRITGAPGDDIPNVDGKWATVARHHYSKDAAWNCDQSLLYLARHQGRPNHLFLNGDTYQVLFARPGAPGAERRWHPREPAIMIYVQDNLVGRWNVLDDTMQTLASFPGYSEFRIGPWEGNLSRDGRMMVVDGKRGTGRIAFAYDLKRGYKYPDLILNDVRIDWLSISSSGKYTVLNGRISGERGDQTQVSDYLTEAHAVPSPDGRRVLWAGNWESPTGRPIGAYVAHVIVSENATSGERK